VRGVSIGLLGMTSAFSRRKRTRTEQEGHSPGSPTQPGTRLRGQPGATVSAFLSSMASANGLLQPGNRAIERQLPDQASNEAMNLQFKASELISSSISVLHFSFGNRLGNWLDAAGHGIRGSTARRRRGRGVTPRVRTSRTSTGLFRSRRRERPPTEMD
jgi:hypothetical protein